MLHCRIHAAFRQPVENSNTAVSGKLIHSTMAGRPDSPASGVGIDAEKMQAKADVTAEQAPRFDYTDNDVKNLISKIDWRIMPFLWGYAVLSAVDVSL